MSQLDQQRLSSGRDGDVFLLGAGATKEDFSAAPLGDDLLQLVLHEDRLDPEVLRFLGSIFDPSVLGRELPKSERPHLDDVFTSLDAPLLGRVPAPKGWTETELIEVRWKLYASVASQIGASLGHGLGGCADRLARHVCNTGGTIISTNYDIVMDNALLTSMNVNYGVAVRGVLRAGGMPDGTGVRANEARTFTLDPDAPALRRGSVELLKIHGSLNWVYCPRCDELDVFLGEKGVVTVLADPGAGRCALTNCTGRYDPIIVGPSFEQRYTSRPLRETWQRADDKLSVAARLIIIGYSMPQSDYLIRYLLTKHFGTRSESVTVITSKDGVESRADRELHFRRLFPKCRFEPIGFKRYLESLGAA